MPNSASKCFLSGPNQLNSSKDYIDRKKAQTIYQTTKNSKTLKQNRSEYNGPIFVNTSSCLGAIGGYNSNNYDLLLNVTKGKYYTNPPCVIVNDSNCGEQKSLCNTVIANSDGSNCSIPNLTRNLYEGPFIIQNQKEIIDSLKSNQCKSLTNNDLLQIDPSNVCTNSFKKIVNDDKLRNFQFPFKFKI